MCREGPHHTGSGQVTLHAGIWTAPAPTALELLAPARDADAGIAAIDHGADAVYIGGPAFGARAAAGNSLDDIARLTAYAHRFNARVFLALNTLFTNEELPLARKLAFELADAGADVLILQDMGLLEGPLPDIELHASTQCDIRTPEKAAFLESVGFSQLVLARELSLPEIAAVRAKLQHARIEFFVHGALCVSYSGQCWMSQALTGRSANRGECSQLCRLPYDVYTEAGTELAKSKHVLSLKDNDQSANLEALIDAAENGKDVLVLVELKARFDEENNIVWAKMLEKAGCHVIYGLVGLKTHSKITLVVRQEEDGIRRYVHLGTGNYNDATAKLYTDVGLLTCAEPIGEDATAVFNMLSGYSEPLNWNMLSVAPLWLRTKFLRLIERETKNARAGKPASIIAKMNSLCDKEIIAALYEASCAGVKIHLVVRGICCLKAGIPGLSENIEVRSIVGEFLEHARIFIFENDGSEEIYMGSADWMPRNLDRRVEILFPVLREELKDRIRKYMELELEDNLKAHVLQPDGTYEKPDRRGKLPVGSQMALCEMAVAAAKNERKKHEQEETARVFIPIESEN